MAKKKSKECKICKWKKECVNVDKFADGDCLAFEKNKK